MIGWGILLAVLLALGLGTYNKIERLAKASALEASRAALQKSADENNVEAEKGAAVVLAKRPARKAALAITQKTRTDNAEATAQADPVYAAWADARVPDAVIDELWAAARPGADSARKRPRDRESVAVVRPDSTPPPAQAGN